MSKPRVKKVIIVTGASRGIGLAVTRFLLLHDHLVVLTARTVGPLASLCTEFPGQVAYKAIDATDLDALPAIVDLAIATYGRLDGVVVNHGALHPFARVADADLDAWKQLYTVNLFSAVALAKAAIPHLRASHGRFILTTSGAASHAFASWAAYGSSKAAGNSLIQHLAVEEPDIVSVALDPGRTDTDMQKTIREQGSTAMSAIDHMSFVQNFKNGTLSPAEKPAEVLAKLAVDAAPELSGKTIKFNAPEAETYHW